MRILSLVAVMVIFAGTQPPTLQHPVLFNTSEADRILAKLRVFPSDNAWNRDISALPVHRNSAAIIASIGPEKRLGYNLDMNFVLVPPDQPRLPVKIVGYP